MLRKKTGILYEFAGRAGTAIGLGDATMTDPRIAYMGDFCSRCGTAFQLQDDILGVIGSAEKTGKPVGADIREGKKTLIVYHALLNANDAQKRELLSIIGKANATADEVARATELLTSLGGIDYTRDLANQMVDEGLELLSRLPTSNYRDLLQQWAEYLVDRQL